MLSRSPICVALCLCACAITCRAHWNEGNPFKMHYPQLPDPAGWDVDVCHYTLADDWQCTSRGLVQQIHFWISWTNDFVGVITNVQLSIYNNAPGPPSHPLALLWQDNFGLGQFTVRPYEMGMQGWYDPLSNWWRRPDHFGIFQINVGLTALNPFEQKLGMIYWLAVKLDVASGLAGWKTSITNFMSASMVWNPGSAQWEELRDPVGRIHPLDLAFVIDPVPEPSLGLALAVIALLRQRHRA